jgi:branched-chain amino acid transport system substrate-binding protein
VKYRAVRFLAVAVVAGLAISMAGCSGKASNTGSTSGAGQTKAPIKIGAIVSLTGTYAGLGDPEQKSINLEVARINAAGGINGHQIEVVFEDDGTDEAKSAAAAAKLIQRDKVVALIGASGTGQTLAARGEADKAGVPMVSMAGGTAVMVPFDKLVFQTPWPNKLVVPFVMNYMKTKGYTKIGVISDTGGYGKDGLAVINTEAPKLGITITKSEVFNPGDADMSNQLTKINASGAQAILMWSAGKETSTIAKNREQLKIKAPIVGGSGIARKQFIDGAGTAAEGVVFGTGKSLLPESWGTSSKEFTVMKDFGDRFSAKYGAQPDIFAGHAYDAINIVAGAMAALPEGFTSAQLRDQIEKTSGLVGFAGAFTFSPTDHNGLTESDLTMYRITGGKWTLEK